MSDVAIRVEGLSKAYQIRHTQARSQYHTLREDLIALAQKPLRRGAAASSRETFWALDDVSFEVKHGEALGIIGRNGAGKSTLLKILSRITKPTKGQATVYGRVGSLLEVGTGFHPELTGRENIFLNGAILGMTRRDIQRHFDEIVAFAEVEQFLDTPVKRYSSGMYMRLAFAVAAHLEPEVLVVDEVLAVGDAAFQKKCLGKMGEVASGGRTVLFVSHNMTLVAELCKRALVLDHGRILTDSPFSKALKLYSSQSENTIVRFSGPGIQEASIIQLGQYLVLEATYHTVAPIPIPGLGFVISDRLGRPICGSNPMIDLVPPTPLPSTHGRVRVKITHPQLRNGTYKVSLWFGDGLEDFFERRDCLVFDVVNMAGPIDQDVNVVGAVAPLCEWEIEPSSAVSSVC